MLITAALPARVQTVPDIAAQVFTEVTALLLGLSFDGPQRQRIRHFIDAYWQRQQQRAMKAVSGTVDFLAQLRQREAGLREVALRLSRPATLNNLAQEAEAGDALAAWLLAQYRVVHPALAPARPDGLPLPRDSVDGQLDLDHFTATEIRRHPAHRPTAAEREQAYRAATARHASLSPEAQFAMAHAPDEAARLNFGWARASRLDRLFGRTDLGSSWPPCARTAKPSWAAGRYGTRRPTAGSSKAAASPN